MRRAGLVATNSIRGGASRRLLDRISQSGAIFDAWDDEPWILDGAAVRVSLICFAKQNTAGEGSARRANGAAGQRRPDGAIDITVARRLADNRGIAYMGDTKGGAFDIPGDLARRWLELPLNPERPAERRRAAPVDERRWTSPASHPDRWIIDFGWEMSEQEAALYEAPYAYILEHARPVRLQNRCEAYAGLLVAPR